MFICPVCDKKFIRKDYYITHEKTHETLEPVEEVAAPAPPPAPASQEITLNFTKKVEILINGKPYFGKSVVAPNIEVAAEIVRIAREAYGPTILM